jgi:hypothetical protein
VFLTKLALHYYILASTRSLKKSLRARYNRFRTILLVLFRKLIKPGRSLYEEDFVIKFSLNYHITSLDLNS